MEMETEGRMLAVDGLDDDETSLDGGDDSGTGAAIALLVALGGFLLAVVFVILRHLLFQA